MESFKAVLRQALPRPVVQLASRLLRTLIPSRRNRDPKRVAGRLWRTTGGEVQSGPFEGLRYVREASWGSIAPFLVGSYESELHEVIERVIAMKPRTVINIGSAEGYYAVGFARRLPAARVYAFDIAARARELCFEMASRNTTTNVIIGTQCSPERLEELAGDHTFVVIDCEGCELEILNPHQCPSLRETVILVELHDFVDADISSKILNRFAYSHRAELYHANLRKDPADWAALTGLNPVSASAAIDEKRPIDPYPMQWALLIPNSDGTWQ